MDALSPTYKLPNQSLVFKNRLRSLLWVKSIGTTSEKRYAAGTGSIATLPSAST